MYVCRILVGQVVQNQSLEGREEFCGEASFFFEGLEATAFILHDVMISLDC